MLRLEDGGAGFCYLLGDFVVVACDLRKLCLHLLLLDLLDALLWIDYLCRLNVQLLVCFGLYGCRTYL